MKHKMSMGLICAVAAGSMAFPFAANAADGTITFNGSITAQTCTVSAASANLTVTLPTVSVGSLTQTGQTAGNTPFSISLTGCAPASGTVHTFFEAGSTTSADGHLSLTGGAGSAGNVKIDLRNSDGSEIVAGAADASQNSLPVNIAADGTATLNYTAQYVATGAATAGTANSTVQFTMVYQ
ncbi:fimbrial protein [Paraburkholderia solisilvae]|uniref:Major fimbrial subunit SMF-1 n=1 Tax=Paraburkholderia solisilvae TaxID=624376 RepID=A0A6J5DJA1_9BURK|nr:fimbrial protein [Paraburkholderia solisilvae]CAB3753554.1 Major fimbrial subunit SMF-1 [Paraburkholderia solisilvae]